MLFLISFLVLMLHIILTEFARMIIFDIKFFVFLWIKAHWKYTKWVLIIPPISFICLISFVVITAIGSIKQFWIDYSKES
jgi:hypothetical protein